MRSESICCSAGLYRLRKNPPPLRALEGRNLMAGANAPGKGEINPPTLQGSHKFGQGG